MSIRLPTQVILDTTISEASATVGASSVGGIGTGVIARQFLLPLDTDNVVMKIQAASVSGTGSVTATFQTSDDGGTTWYDVVRTPFFYPSANSQVTSIVNATALWASIPVISNGVKTQVAQGSVVAVGSIIANSSVVNVTGSAAAQTLGVGQVSGLPILGQSNRVILQYGGTMTSNDGIRIKVLANSQNSSS